MKNVCSLFLFFVGATHLVGQPTEFVILVTSYNNEAYVDHCLTSLITQVASRPFQIIYVNDCSTDTTQERVERFAEKHNLDESQLLLINNRQNIGSGVGNIYSVVHSYIDDQKVVVCVDGDDYLSHSGVLARLEKEYADPAVWMTYGRFVVYPAGEFWTACQGYPDDIIERGAFREHPNVPSHLKTFRAKLFKRIKKEDLTDTDGTFYKKAWDMAMLFPMLEMCAPAYWGAPNHSRYIDDTVLYIYNFANPEGDAQTEEGRNEQVAYDHYIRSEKEKYSPLESLFDEAAS